MASARAMNSRKMKAAQTGLKTPKMIMNLFHCTPRLRARHRLRFTGLTVPEPLEPALEHASACAAAKGVATAVVAKAAALSPAVAREGHNHIGGGFA